MLSSVEASDIFSAIIKYSINLEKTFVPPLRTVIPAKAEISFSQGSRFAGSIVIPSVMEPVESSDRGMMS
ncbi:hypothetical protein [Marinoscillum luteum]|uniref:Uncharacterized protein n=1 Tax=Marinoscillum luteum TaxID=861051 RepID=A0ABW7NDD2_9BACT